ncbi:hypothetical protein [Acidovorax cavernicola]|uniref:Uncharacterized protein n=1 Tax=Acidovorax cavernicola TaxID=1675792 RepID=A0A9X8D9L1_9BURK|nr:hypothetical protein [Acidovorax cavernicola]RIX85385.1 hypothetical protein D3H34_02330 [Acidovorax cavernicola]
MLKIKNMNKAVEEALAGVRADIQAEFGRYFNELISGDFLELPEKTRGASLHEITDVASLEALPTGPGFYVIFSSCAVEGVPSRLRLADGRRAIYRGEGRFVQRRVESHLFKEAHDRLHAERKLKNSSEQRYGVCLRLAESDEAYGINVDRLPHCRERWAVLVVRLPDSLSDIRKQAEIAFDTRFGRPAASRETKKKTEDDADESAFSAAIA